MDLSERGIQQMDYYLDEYKLHRHTDDGIMASEYIIFQCNPSFETALPIIKSFENSLSHIDDPVPELLTYHKLYWS
jgi:hypothetical protein